MFVLSYFLYLDIDQHIDHQPINEYLSNLQTIRQREFVIYSKKLRTRQSLDSMSFF